MSMENNTTEISFTFVVNSYDILIIEKKYNTVNKNKIIKWILVATRILSIIISELEFILF